MRDRDPAGYRAPRRRTRRPLLRAVFAALGVTAFLSAALLLAAWPGPPHGSGAGRLATGNGTSPLEMLDPALAAERQAALAEIAALGAEAASLRAAVAGERALLAALERQRAALENTVEALRREAARPSDPAAPVPPSSVIAGVGGGETGGEIRAAAQTVAAAAETSGAEARPAEPMDPPAASGGAEPPPLPLPPTPVAAPAPEAAPPVRVFVHHRAGSTAAEAAALALLGPLREAGFEPAGLRPVPAVPSTRVVRYFHSGDGPAAVRLAGQLGRGWAIQDFRAFTPLPEPKTLEIWLPTR
jgi:hypothetical protein